MTKLTKFAAGLALALCLTGATAGPALADASDSQPLGACIKEPKVVCAD